MTKYRVTYPLISTDGSREFDTLAEATRFASERRLICDQSPYLSVHAANRVAVTTIDDQRPAVTAIEMRATCLAFEVFVQIEGSWRLQGTYWLYWDAVKVANKLAAEHDLTWEFDDQRDTDHLR